MAYNFKECNYDQALTGKPITVYGDGSQTRSFCYVDDRVEGLIRLMNSPDDFTGPVNLGNFEETTILRLAEKIPELASSPSEIIFKPLPPEDPSQRRLDITLAKEKLGCFPRVSLEEGLRKTAGHCKAFFRERLRT